MTRAGQYRENIGAVTYLGNTYPGFGPAPICGTCRHQFGRHVIQRTVPVTT